MVRSCEQPVSVQRGKIALISRYDKSIVSRELANHAKLRNKHTDNGIIDNIIGLLLLRLI